MRLTLDELETCLFSVLAMLRSRGIEFAETDRRDFYWSVLSGDWLDFQKEPDIAVGSLDDDVQGLRRLLSDPSGASAIDLERLAAVLKLLSEDLVETGSRTSTPVLN